MIKYKELIRIVEADGWFMVGSRGSHRYYRHLLKSGQLTIPFHGSRTAGKGLVNSILKKAGLK